MKSREDREREQWERGFKGRVRQAVDYSDQIRNGEGNPNRNYDKSFTALRRAHGEVTSAEEWLRTGKLSRSAIMGPLLSLDKAYKRFIKDARESGDEYNNSFVRTAERDRKEIGHYLDIVKSGIRSGESSADIGRRFYLVIPAAVGLLGIFLLSGNITGNVIASSVITNQANANILGVILFVLGVVGTIFFLKR